MKILFIGAGKVGCSLAKYFHKHNLNVLGCYSRSQENRQQFEKIVECPAFDQLERCVPQADLIFITTTDTAIHKIWLKLSKFPLHKKVIVHCSGSLSSKILRIDDTKNNSNNSQKDLFVASCHPLQAIPNKKSGNKQLKHAFFTIEGHANAVQTLEKIFLQTGNPIKSIYSKDKTRYHASAVMASNLVTALISKAQNELQKCGFNQAEAHTALSFLISNNINNVLEKGCIEALTGPIERADIETIQRHLESLSDNKTLLMYKLLSLELVELAEKKHPQRDYQKVKNLLGA